MCEPHCCLQYVAAQHSILHAPLPSITSRTAHLQRDVRAAADEPGLGVAAVFLLHQGRRCGLACAAHLACTGRGCYAPAQGHCVWVQRRFQAPVQQLSGYVTLEAGLFSSDSPPLGHAAGTAPVLCTSYALQTNRMPLKPPASPLAQSSRTRCWLCLTALLKKSCTVKVRYPRSAPTGHHPAPTFQSEWRRGTWGSFWMMWIITPSPLSQWPAEGEGWVGQARLSTVNHCSAADQGSFCRVCSREPASKLCSHRPW